MIIVDGCKCDKDLANFANLEEALSHLMEDETMSDRVITDVLVNNETFSEIYPHQAEDIACSNISSLEVRSMPASTMAVEMSAEMSKVARMMANGARNVARLFREASDADALELFQDLLDVTRDFLSTISLLRDKYLGGVDEDYVAKTEKMADLLSEMTDVLENEDWILLADLLEYEFLPQCAEWQNLSEHIHNQLLACAA